MHGAQRRAIVRTMAVAAALVGSLVVVVQPAAPAAAASHPIGVPTIDPQTWVDGEGRQHVLVSSGFDGESLQLLVARHLPTGQPDPTWGDDPVRPGVAVVEVVPPSSQTAPERVLSIDAEGAISIVWRDDPDCLSDEPCDRWFTRYDAATGAAVAAPQLHVGAPPLLRPLPGGAFLTGTIDGDQTDIGWVESSGYPMNASVLTGSEPVAIDSDGAGSIYVVDVAGQLTWWTEGYPQPSLELDTACDPDEPIAVGAAQPGFAIACTMGDPGVLTVSRHGSDGQVLWSSSAAGTGVAVPELLAVDDLDRVWVAGHRTVPVPAPPVVAKIIVAAAVTEAGAEAPAYQRETINITGAGSQWDLGGGVRDLRSIGEEVALADLQVCCRTSNNTFSASRVHGEILPVRPSPPTCVPGTISLAPGGAGSLGLSFVPCPSGLAHERPTSYLVTATGPAGAQRVEVPHGPGPTISATIEGLTGGTLVRTSVTAHNDEGPSLGGPRIGPTTVLPFTSVDAFTFRMYNTLVRDIWWDRDGAGLVASVETGAVTPVDLAASMLEDGVAEARVEPLARLYLAVLGRHPDTGGLRYWIGRSEAGERLGRIAERLAASPEFRRRYGGLSDRGFVQQLYRNVLGREGDPTGIDFWTRRLRARIVSRGALVAQLSQSPEHVRRTDPTIQPLAATFLLLDRVPTSAERAAWATATPRATALAAIFDSTAFATKVDP
jgi:hypothetical protein